MGRREELEITFFSESMMFDLIAQSVHIIFSFGKLFGLWIV